MDRNDLTSSLCESADGTKKSIGFESLCRLIRTSLGVSHAMFVIERSGVLVADGWSGDDLADAAFRSSLVSHFQDCCEPVIVENSAGSHLTLPNRFKFSAWVPFGLSDCGAYGAVALFDEKPLRFGAEQRAMLGRLIDVAADLLRANTGLDEAESAVSDRNRVEMALAESQARFSRVADNIPGMLYQFLLTHDGAMSMPFVGSGCLELFGVEPEAAMEDHQVLISMLDPEERGGLRRSILQSALTGRLWEWTGRFQLESGESKWIRGASRPTYRLNGDIVWDGLMLDITPAKVAQHALEQSEATLRLTLDSAFDGIVTVDRSGAIVGWNPQAEHIFGWSHAEAIGSPASIVTPEHLREAQEHWRIADECPPSRHLEVPLLRRDGQVFMAELAISSIRTESDARVVGFVRDISERIKNEQDLREAKERAERANSGKSEFVSRMSHELRTPLNAILGFSQILLTENIGPDAAESVTQIKNAGEHLLSLINEILDIARIEAGRLTFEPEEVDLGQIITNVASLVQPLAAQSGVRICVRFGEDLTGIHADPHRVRQILINLVSNGIKYNRPDGLLQLSVHQDADSVSVQVRDEGPGIEPEDMGRLFVPFDRIGAERSRIEGTGLGLPLTKRLVEAMGGYITVSSLVGSGSIFTVTLPKRQPADRMDGDRGLLSA